MQDFIPTRMESNGEINQRARSHFLFQLYHSSVPPRKALHIPITHDIIFT